ncbi:cellulase family glycosylhydrolase [Mariniflexile sp. HMF6888]|uniref:cellulase family glycosylhydrolase n=1 Tax=Mariniflexile sp. HMF6888 TaxID=3373086 RepID=UPI0037BD0D83
MKSKHFYQILLLLCVIVTSVSCSSSDEGEDPTLTVSVTEVSFEPDGGTSDVSLTTNGTWTVSNPATSWLQINNTSGGSGTATITLTSGINGSGLTRSATLTVSSSNGQARRITVTQTGNLYPSYNLSPKPADATGMNSTAIELAAKVTLGINIGNTMEAFRTDGDVVISDETAWGNPKITEGYIQFLKATGFNAVRIPCSWVQGNLSDESTMKIDPTWLNRVKEVVGWCVNNDMYVLLNIHWDGGWLDHNINNAKKEVTNAKQKALWEQIATTMIDFDEHLMFAGANEPPADDAQEMAVLNSYYETFIKAVRSTGGRNSYRTLVVPGPGTNASLSYDLMNTLPYDPVPNRLMLEVHEYTPSQFCFLDEVVSWGSPVFYWGAGNHSTIEPEANATYGEEDAILDSFRKLKERFIDKGVPVLLGEYAAMRRDRNYNGVNYLPKDMAMHNKSVDYWNTFVTKQCKINGVIPFYWEVGNVLNRNNNTIKDQAMIDALKAALN